VGQRAAFSPDGQWLATSGDAVRVWEVGSWREKHRFEAPRRAAVAFSPDNKMLAFETGYGVVRLVDPESGREWARLENPNLDWAGRICFTPDGTQLLTSTTEGIHVWDLRAIRARLARMGLDWDLPPYPPADERELSPLEMKAETGDFFGVLKYRDPVTIKLNTSLLELDPFDAEAYYERGRAYGPQNEHKKAIADYSKALLLLPSRDSRWADALWRRANNYEALKNHDRMLADVQQLVGSNLDESFEWNAHLAWMCNGVDGFARQLVTGPQEDPLQALVLAQKAVTLTTPELPEFLNTLGLVQYRLGQYDKAIETLERSARATHGEEVAENMFLLALCHNRRGETAKAKICFDRGAQALTEWQDQLGAKRRKELDTLRAEAEALLRQQVKH
jgi:tetratricopeptide (TPR) repeat protein